MPLQITGRHVEITEGQKEYIEKKIQRFRRMFDRIDEMAFTLTAERHQIIVEAHFRAGTIHAVTKSADADAKAAIDAVVDKIEVQITKAKKKRSEKKHEKYAVPE